MARSRYGHDRGLSARMVGTLFGLAGFEALSQESWRWGWVAGVGAEWAVTDRLSVRSEALYIDLAQKSHTALSPTLLLNTGFGTVNFKESGSMWVARLAANYKFSN